MAINVSFNGATIYKPGAYSRSTIDLGGAFPLGPAGIVGIFGESEQGRPGDSETDIRSNVYTAAEYGALKGKYGSGPIVDAARFLFAPAADAAVPAGAQAIYVYKTNASIQASLALAASYGTVKAREYGKGGNRITATISEISEIGPKATSTGITFTPVAEETQATCVADIADSLDTTYWTISSGNDVTDYYVWYSTPAAGADPAPVGKTGIQVNIGTGDTDVQVASATQIAVNAVIDFSAVVNGTDAEKVDITAAATGPVVDAVDVSSGFTITVPTQGDSADATVLNGKTFRVLLQGENDTVITLSATESDHDTIAKLAIELNLQLPAGMTAEDDSGTLVLKTDADVAAASKGYGKTFELVDDQNPGDLAALGLVAGVTYITGSNGIESAVTVVMSNKRDLIDEDDTLGGNVVVTAGHDGSGGVTTAQVTIDADKVTLTTNLGSVDFTKDDYVSLGDMVSEMNLQSGWSVALESALYGQLGPDVLDQVTTLGAFSVSGGAARIKKDASEIADFFDTSAMSEMTSQSGIGLPAALTETSLTGGAKGASSSADMVSALDEFTKIRLNSVTPLFSRDAADDIGDGLTDASSTYSIAAIHQGVKTHLSLMGTTKRRSERQGYLSMKASYEDCKLQSQTLADARIQLGIQDVRQVDTAGTIKWFQPWAFACMIAGARGGSPVGTPLTNKYMNVSGIRQTAQPMSTPEEDVVQDFDPDTQFDNAILNNITFMEAPQTGGFKIVADNTTYGRDGNFVFNRGSVLYATDIVAFELRRQLDAIYVGVKNTATSSEISSTASSILDQFVSQAIIIDYSGVSSRIEGSTVYVTATVTIVEGIEFILTDITIQRNQG